MNKNKDKNKEQEIITEYKYGFNTKHKNIVDSGYGLNEEVIKLITTENEKVDLNRVAKNQKLNFEIAIKPRTAFDKLFINVWRLIDVSIRIISK